MTSTCDICGKPVELKSRGAHRKRHDACRAEAKRRDISRRRADPAYKEREWAWGKGYRIRRILAEEAS